MTSKIGDIDFSGCHYCTHVVVAAAAAAAAVYRPTTENTVVVIGYPVIVASLRK